MIKNLTIFRAGEELPNDADTFETAMQRLVFTPCGATQPSTCGWVPPRGEDGGLLIEVVGGQWIACLMLEQRMLPGAVVKRKVAAMAKDLEEKTGRVPKGKALRELKEEATLALLPQAFTRQTKIMVWINPQTKLIGVDTSSANKASAVAEALIACAPGMNLHGLQTRHDVSACMTTWLVEGDAPSGFTIDREGELQSDGENPATVKLAECDMTSSSVTRHLESGLRVTQLAMSYLSRVSFVLNATGQIKRIHFLDLVMDSVKSDSTVDSFDADVALFTGEASNLMAALIAELGGETDLPIIEAAKAAEQAEDSAGSTAEDDPMFEQACTVVRVNNKGSISAVQRHLRIGYNRAARLLERMQREGLLQPISSNGTYELAAKNDVAEVVA